MKYSSRARGSFVAGLVSGHIEAVMQRPVERLVQRLAGTLLEGLVEVLVETNVGIFVQAPGDHLAEEIVDVVIPGKYETSCR